MKAISLHYNITDQLSDYVMAIAIYIGMIDNWINRWPDKADPSRRHFGRAVDRSIIDVIVVQWNRNL